MLENRIRALRQQKGKSQKELAALVGTSQQQIQRIEAGRQSIRFDLAVRVSEALGAPIQVVFPGTEGVIARSLEEGQTLHEMLVDHAFEREMGKAGVDVDFCEWSISYRLRGGIEGFWSVSAHEKGRLWYAVQRRSGGLDGPFATFETGTHNVILNLNHLLFCQFLFDPPERESTNEVEAVDGWGPVLVYLSDSDKPFNFDVDPDSPEEDTADDEGQFRHLLLTADLLMDEDINDVFHFTDVDGETAFFRASDVAMITIPLSVVEPDLLDADDEEDEDEEEEIRREGKAGSP
ncbi:MAG: helix-turn-helix transcriptional regulator [Dehalococcoidia bacterium]